MFEGNSASELELTILMPCLNEAETIKTCVEKALCFLKNSGIIGEVLIADNGSSDGSQEIAVQSGARVVNVPQKGYGNALLSGIKEAKGKFVIMGDADDSYDFLSLSPFVKKLREGDDLVMGNRFKGGIEPGAMPPLHKYLGNPVLSGIGKLFFRVPIGDFHCGLRGFRKKSIDRINLHTTGMEFASEMVVKASLNNLKIAEVPTKLKKDGRSRPPHLRSWRDDWRHLKFLLMHSPNWLFMYPGMFMFAVGLLLILSLLPAPIEFFGVTFDIHTMLFGASFVILGYNMILFSIYTKVYATSIGMLPGNSNINVMRRYFTPDTGTIVGIIVFMIGIFGSFYSFSRWGRLSFGELTPSSMMRIAIPSVTCLIVGLQTILSGFFLGILGIKHR